MRFPFFSDDGERAICMSRAAMFLLVATVCKAGSMCQNPPSRHELRKYLTPEGRLQARLVLRDGQQGFAGVSGEIWTIEPEGHLSIARFLNDKTDPPYRERTLAPAELKELGKVLAKEHFVDLPNSFGRDVKVDAHVLTLGFGTKQSTLVLQGGETVSDETTPPADDPQTSAWCNFIAIVKALQKLTRDQKRAE
jgi:hypothetical protein